MNKKIIVPALVLGAAVAVGALSYVGATSAAGNGFGGGEMASNLAEKLGVEESQVDAAMEEMRGEKRAVRQAEQEEKLSEAVTDGVITDEQKQAIIDYRSEMHEDREQKRAENQTWMEESGIDHEALREYTGGGEGREEGHGGMRGLQR